MAPDKVGGHRSWILEPHRDLICGLIGKTPHLTIDRLQDLLAARGITVWRDTIWRFLRREGLRFKKKTLFALEQTRWQTLKRQLKADRGRRPRKPPNGIKTNMAPLRGWADKGSRLKGFAPHGHWRTLAGLIAEELLRRLFRHRTIPKRRSRRSHRSRRTGIAPRDGIKTYERQALLHVAI